MSPAVRVAVLTVSDTAFANASLDRSGPTIREIVRVAGCECLDDNDSGTAIVPDEIAHIQAAVQRWIARGDVDWIITTGGTGFGVRDRTPEAVAPLLDRHAPGLVHIMLSSSLKKTPLAALSRPVAGTISSTLVTTLPGSVKAARENLEALFDGGAIFHAISLTRGGSGSQVHRALASGNNTTAAAKDEVRDAAETGHAHYHHHHHHHHHHHDTPTPRTHLSNDPSLPVSVRQRESPYPIIPFHNAIQLVLTEISRLPIVELRVQPNLAGHVLAEDVTAPTDVPATPTTSVDGYALRSTDEPGTYPVVTPSTHPRDEALAPATLYRINTGAPLPRGADAVIMVEDTRLAEADASGEELRVQTLAQVPAGENVRNASSDVAAGALVLRQDTVVSAKGGEIGTLAFVGRKSVKVYRKPVVAILSTGNEIVDLQATGDGTDTSGESAHWGGIFDTNRPSLQAALEGLGYTVVDLGIVGDTREALVQKIQSALHDIRADILLTTGGTSMGPSDLLKPALEREFAGTIHFGRVALKPGKPTTFASVDIGERKVPVFALPGNPASALVTFYVFVVPALRVLGGWEKASCELPRVQVQIQDTMPLDPRPEFHRVVVRAGPQGLKAYSTGGQRSSRVASLAGANALVALPAHPKDSSGPAKLEKGENVAAVIIGELETE